ncbi:hypothetical protein GNP82_08280 [Aliivibrio fischeri]|uniref:hypothetical protein n=1 Tax=Aliivibrio fischeri TaxID=668 RepID=UPI0012D9E517|nr:hypothetical protein [Aliivibrio fischeri]MUK37546.1 hypothetical protein [Aliivibrio fischeri]
MKTLIKTTSIVALFSLLFSFVYYDEINSLFTFTYTKEITMEHSETLSIGVLDLIRSYISNGVFYSSYVAMSQMNTWALIFVGLIFTITFWTSRKNKESLTNTTKLWFIVLFTYAFTQIITHNFNLNYLANEWGFTITNGASVPTSPYSLTTTGQMIEYHYWLSIKNFFANFKWGVVDIVICTVVVLWASIKAFSLAYDATKEQSKVSDLLLVPFAALLSLFAVLFLPYRLSESNKEEQMIKEKQLEALFLRIGFSEKRANHLVQKINQPTSMMAVFKDNQATFIHTIMKVVKSK